MLRLMPVSGALSLGYPECWDMPSGRPGSAFLLPTDAGAEAATPGKDRPLVRMNQHGSSMLMLG